MTGFVSRTEWRWALIGAIIVVIIATVPYLIAWTTTPDGKVYTGFLVNPLDGHSYLAKMRQGAEGEWLFRLPFTPEPQSGVFFYVYYLFLGHLSALISLPLIVTYHIARFLAGILLLALIYRFIAEFIAEVRQRRVAFVIVAVSSGIGWALAPTGTINLDLWVPEANTFYSIFANAHFPLAEAAILLFFLAVAAPLDARNSPGASISGTVISRSNIARFLLAAGASLLLAFVQTFALVTVYVILGIFLLWRSLTQRLGFSGDWIRLVLSGMISLPVVVYYLVTFSGDPFLAAWSSQNITLTPPFWQILAGYGFLVPLAVAGSVWCFRQRRGMFLIVWTIFNLALIYAPFALQRRLLLGFHIPVAILAALGLVKVVWPLVGSRRSLVTVAVLVLLVPSTLIIMLAPVAGTMQSKWPLYMTYGERQALTWLRNSTSPDDIVLASPEMGLMIPAWAGNRVVYGHPFETVQAEEKKAEVGDFFNGSAGPVELLRKYGIRYIFIGPKEKNLGAVDLRTVETQLAVDIPYSNEEVTIYQVSLTNGGES